IEKIFRPTNCPNELKVTYTTYMLVGEVKYWWQRAQRLMEARASGEVQSRGTPIVQHKSEGTPPKETIVDSKSNRDILELNSIQEA
ncbi:hypothetical protein CR513_51724, partial [Mucuna pruriens]